MRVSLTAEIAPLSVNRAYAPAKWGKRQGFRKTPEAAKYAEALRLAACFNGERRLLSGPLRATIAFYWPTEAGDVDGPIKLTLDALQGHVYENDRQVKELRVTRLKDAAHPRVVVEVDELAPPPTLEELVNAPGFVKAVERTKRDLRALLPPKKRETLLRGKAVSSVKSYRETLRCQGCGAPSADGVCEECKAFGRGE